MIVGKTHKPCVEQNQEKTLVFLKHGQSCNTVAVPKAKERNKKDRKTLVQRVSCKFLSLSIMGWI